MKELYENNDGTWKTWYWVMFIVGLSAIIGLNAYIGLHS